MKRSRLAVPVFLSLLATSGSIAQEEFTMCLSPAEVRDEILPPYPGSSWYIPHKSSEKQDIAKRVGAWQRVTALVFKDGDVDSVLCEYQYTEEKSLPAGLSFLSPTRLDGDGWEEVENPNFGGLTYICQESRTSCAWKPAE